MSTLRLRGCTNDADSFCYICDRSTKKKKQTKYNSIHKECLLCLLRCETGGPGQVLSPTQSMYSLYVNIQLVDERKKAFLIWSSNGMARATKSS